MSDKKFLVIFNFVLLTTLATGTVWANAPIASNARISPGQPAPMILDNGAASGELRTYALPRQNYAMANQDVLVATLEVSLLSQNPAAHSTRNLSVVSPVPRQDSALPSNKNSAYSTFARIGIFGSAEGKVTTAGPAGQVQTGVFWSPRGLSGRGQGYSPANALKSGFFGIPSGPGVGNGTGERRGVQGHRLRKPGGKSGIWRGL
jgi:hypothetical protein